jgi:hypothetical protein
MGYLYRLFIRHAETTNRISVTIAGLAAFAWMIWGNFFRESLPIPYIEDVLSWTMYVFGASWMLHVLIIAGETFYRQMRDKKSLQRGDLYLMATSLIFFQAFTLFAIGEVNGWFASEPKSDWGPQIKVLLIIVDTILKGVLLDFMESFDLDISTFEPERGAFALKVTVFVFRSLWAVVFAAFAFVAFNRWRSALR